MKSNSKKKELYQTLSLRWMNLILQKQLADLLYRTLQTVCISSLLAYFFTLVVYRFCFNRLFYEFSARPSSSAQIRQLKKEVVSCEKFNCSYDGGQSFYGPKSRTTPSSTFTPNSRSSLLCLL